MTRPNKPEQIIIIPLVSIEQMANVQLIRNTETEKEGNVLFNDALNTFYLRLYDVEHMVKDHSDSERGNPLPPHGLLVPYRIPFSCIYIYIHVSQCLSAVYQTEKTQDWIPPQKKNPTKNPTKNTRKPTHNNNKKQQQKTTPSPTKKQNNNKQTTTKIKTKNPHNPNSTQNKETKQQQTHR